MWATLRGPAGARPESSPLAALAALHLQSPVLHLQWHAAHPWSMIRSSTSADSSASPASLHGSSRPSLMFSSLQLPRERVTAELELSCSILSTRESDPTKSAGSVKERAVEMAAKLRQPASIPCSHVAAPAARSRRDQCLLLISSSQLQLDFLVAFGYICRSNTYSAEAHLWRVLRREMRSIQL